MLHLCTQLVHSPPDCGPHAQLIELEASNLGAVCCATFLKKKLSKSHAVPVGGESKSHSCQALIRLSLALVCLWLKVTAPISLPLQTPPADDPTQRWLNLLYSTINLSIRMELFFLLIQNGIVNWQQPVHAVTRQRNPTIQMPSASRRTAATVAHVWISRSIQ